MCKPAIKPKPADMIRKFILTVVVTVAAVIVSQANAITGKPFCDVTGGVVEAGLRKPLNNVSVVAISRETMERRTVTTDSNGEYYFEDLKAGRYKLIFQKGGYKRVVWDDVLVQDDCGFRIKVEMTRKESFQIIPGLLLFGA